MHFKRIKQILLVLLLFHSLTGFGQYNWWNNLHNWDGHTNWYYYLKFAPRYLGPNALPVPSVSEGILQEHIELETAAVLHFSEGDNTQNLLGRLYWPFAKGRAAVEVWGVPLEHYHMDSATRDDRVARDYDGEGYASGDVHFNSYFQLVKGHERWPDVLLRINLRAPSGNGVEAARYTDAPGYAFDLSTHKEFTLNAATTLDWHVMGGFYFWQTNKRNKQNDAYLFGTGAALTHRKLTVKAAFAGYSGYTNKGDRPLVLRGGLRYALSQHASLKFKMQKGLHDFAYTSFRLAALFYLKPPESAKKSGE